MTGRFNVNEAVQALAPPQGRYFKGIVTPVNSSLHPSKYLPHLKKRTSSERFQQYEKAQNEVMIESTGDLCVFYQNPYHRLNYPVSINSTLGYIFSTMHLYLSQAKENSLPIGLRCHWLLMLLLYLHEFLHLLFFRLSNV